MLKHFQNRTKQGQSTLEYAILIVIIIAALLSVQVYIKRGIQGRFKSATDDIGDQFSPSNTTETAVTAVTGSSNQTFAAGVSTTTQNPETTTVTVDSNIANTDEYWGPAGN
ncbi:hypothetical protein ACFL49_02825 [Candidatus Omnitrophota bacterium]